MITLIKPENRTIRSFFNFLLIQFFFASFMLNCNRVYSQNSDKIISNPTEIKINNLFLTKSASDEQIKFAINQIFNGDLKGQKLAAENIYSRKKNGDFFVLTSEYTDLVKSFEIILMETNPKLNNSDNREKLQRVYPLEIYLERLKKSN